MKYKHHTIPPYRVCPLGAHADHGHGLVTGYALDKDADLWFTHIDDGHVHLEPRSFEGVAGLDVTAPSQIKGHHWSDYTHGAKPALHERFEWLNMRRIADFLVATFCLILFSPLFLLCYILIKREDGGPAIFKQERIGRFGRPFFIYKFRSMRVDAEKDGPALYLHDNETRMTKVGKFLREHHLDELPQLWNVFKGDMAFIGPRPERKYYIDQIMEHDKRYVYLYQIRPGVTSYATLYNGYTDTMEKMLRRLELDLYYLEHRSWWFDIKILTLTFLNIVFGKKF